MASILELDNIFTPAPTALENPPQKGAPVRISHFLSLIHSFLQRKTASSITIKHSLSRKETSFLFPATIRSKYKALIECRVETVTKSCTILAKIVLRDTLNCIRSFEMTKSMCKITMLINLLSNKHSYDVFVQSWNGQLQFKRPSIFENFGFGTALSCLSHAITDIIKFMENFMGFIHYNCNAVSLKTFLETSPDFLTKMYLDERGEIANFGQLKEILPFLTTELKKDDPSSKKQTSLQHSAALLKKNFNEHFQLLRQNSFYLSADGVERSHPYLSAIDPKSICKDLAFPKNEADQNNYIFNTVEILNVQEEKKKTLVSGRKMDLVLLPVKFRSAGQSEQAKGKVLVMKVPSKKKEQFRAAEIRYEKEILSLFKEESCVYLNRYYDSEANNFPYKNCLMMDFINGLTLHDFTESKKIFLSQTSKLRLLVHISNCIRFLEKHEVSHIDLSPNNLMVVSDFMIKIIDFGQAYSPKVTPKYLSKGKQLFKYNPGKTLPFAPPQIYSRTCNLTSRQDIFSLGIIAFKMLFGIYPINCSEPVLQKVYARGVYSDRIFTAPEQIEDLGGLDLHLILLNLVFRMINPEENSRPNPEWAHILLKRTLSAQRI